MKIKTLVKKKTFYLTLVADIAALASAEYGDIDMANQSKLTPELAECLMI